MDNFAGTDPTGTLAPYPIRAGSRFLPGATPSAEGVNFCVFSRHATRVELLLYADADSTEPFQIVPLCPERNRTFFFWHVFVEGLRPGLCYTWRVDGPSADERPGSAFDARRELLDPWARAVTDRHWDRARAAQPADQSHSSLRAIVVKCPQPQDSIAARGLEGAVIYEMHVGGFTRHPASGVRRPGTFSGAIEKIPYLRSLGVTHVQLLPVMAFDEQDVPRSVAARGLRNFWGYSTHGFYSPHPRYCADAARAPQEFRALTDALHDAGIDVLLDVVFNHTAEGGADGPTIHFKGLANDICYHLESSDRRRYRDYTGCGNTMNCNHPLVASFIVQCLEYWVEVMGVDGFRFDLASVFARDQNGAPMADPLLPWLIETSPVLSRVPLIAEAWDAAGLYHVGAFPGMAWAEWNGRYRDVMRRFLRGDPGLVSEVATRIAGSADLYAAGGRLPTSSINFITCHDGFTLHDLMSYNRKHNEANGESNRDGSDDNSSWNCGAEGETADAAVSALRRRQMKNAIAMLMLSRGVPMLLAGDEVMRSQGGNNNAWCQDNEVSWFDWRRAEDNGDMLRYTREAIALRRRHASLTVSRFFDGRPVPGRGIADIAWHGARPDEPPWHDPNGRFLAFTVAGLGGEEEDLHAILNMSDRVLEVGLPAVPGRRWHVAIDTSRLPLQDIVPRERQKPYPGGAYIIRERSIAVLEARA